MLQRHGREILELVLVKMVLLVMFLAVRGGYRSATADVVARGFEPILAASAATEASTAVSAGSLRPGLPARAELLAPGPNDSGSESDFKLVFPGSSEDGRESSNRLASDSRPVFP